MFVAKHATRNGASGGGTRMKVYATPADGLLDAMRLSEAMSLKMAIAGAPHGGGKAHPGGAQFPLAMPVAGSSTPMATSWSHWQRS